VFRKKGAFNTPSEILFFKKENGGLIFSIKAAAQLCYLHLTARYQLPNDGFFLFAVTGRDIIIYSVDY